MPGSLVRQFSIAVWLVAAAVADANDLWIGAWDSITRQEAIVAQLADRAAGRLVQHRDLDRLASHRRLGVLADQLAGDRVVRGEKSVGRVDRVRRAVEGDDEHSL